MTIPTEATGQRVAKRWEADNQQTEQSIDRRFFGSRAQTPRLSTAGLVNKVPKIRKEDYTGDSARRPPEALVVIERQEQ
jgi:hypothetical protein